eukprot:6205323-Pleurochrysis_carterae.AAC.2
MEYTSSCECEHTSARRFGGDSTHTRARRHCYQVLGDTRCSLHSMLNDCESRSRPPARRAQTGPTTTLRAVQKIRLRREHGSEKEPCTRFRKRALHDIALRTEEGKREDDESEVARGRACVGCAESSSELSTL